MQIQSILKTAIAIWAFTTLLFMAAMSIGAALFSGAFIFVLYKQPSIYKDIKAELIKNSFFWASISICIVAIFSIVAASLNPPLGLAMTNYKEIKKIQYFIYPFALAMALYYLRSLESGFLNTIKQIFLYTAAAASLAGVFQFWAPSIIPAELLTGIAFFRKMAYSTDPHALAMHFHSQGFMQFHLSFATVMFFPLSLVAAELFWGNSKHRLVLSTLVVLFVLAIFYTFSRTAWLSLILWSAMLVFLWRPKLLFFAIPVVFLSAYIAWSHIPIVKERLADPMSLDGRKIVWRVAWEMFADRPLTGVGFAKTGDYSDLYAQKVFGQKQWFSSHAHNNLLDALAAMGIAGLLAYIAWWTVLFIFALRAFRSAIVEVRVWGAAFLLGCFSFQINGLSQVNFYDAKSQHTLFFWTGIILYLEIRRRLELKQTSYIKA